MGQDVSAMKTFDYIYIRPINLNSMYKAFYLVTIILLYCINPCSAQEKEYKAALDSLNKYINFAKGTNLLTWYAPGMYNVMSEEVDSINFYGMTYNNKTKIVISTGNPLYMFNLSLMDTSAIRINRGGGIYIQDKDSTKFMYHSAQARIFNAKYGGVPIYEVKLFEGNAINAAYTEKIIFYFKQAIVYSKKVKVKRKELIKLDY